MTEEELENHNKEMKEQSEQLLKVQPVVEGPVKTPVKTEKK
jgi:hypothetical protein